MMRRDGAATKRPSGSRALVYKMFRAIDDGDWGSLVDLFDSKVVYERPGYEPHSGLEQVLHFYQYERVIVSGNHRIDEVILEGNVGTCRGRIVGIKRDGSALDEDFTDWYHFSNGRIIWRRSYFFRPAV